MFFLTYALPTVLFASPMRSAEVAFAGSHRITASTLCWSWAPGASRGSPWTAFHAPAVDAAAHTGDDCRTHPGGGRPHRRSVSALLIPPPNDDPHAPPHATGAALMLPPLAMPYCSLPFIPKGSLFDRIACFVLFGAIQCLELIFAAQAQGGGSHSAPPPPKHQNSSLGHHAVGRVFFN